MFLVNLKLAPETIANLFKYNFEYHQYNTRSSSKFHYTAASNNLLLRSFKNVGPRIWNNLNDNIVACESMCIFKKNLKQNLVNLYNTNWVAIFLSLLFYFLYFNLFFFKSLFPFIFNVLCIKIVYMYFVGGLHLSSPWASCCSSYSWNFLMFKMFRLFNCFQE